MGNGKKNKGFSTLLFTMVVLVSITLFSFVSADAVVGRQTAIKSIHQTQSAFNTAQAGLSYAIPYLDNTYATISDGDTVTQTLSDGSSFSVAFTFINGKDLMKVTSTGTSADGTNTKTVSELVQYQSSSVISFPIAAMVREKLEMRDNSQIISDQGATVTTQVGGTNSRLRDNAETILDSGVSSYENYLANDIEQGDSNLQTKTDAELEAELLGQEISAFQTVTTESSLPENAGDPQGTYIYDYNSNTFAPYAGSTSYTINQVDGEAQLKGNEVLGTAENPIVLEVNLSGTYTLPSGTVKNSEFQLRQNAKIYGDLIVHGNAHFSSNVEVTGNVIVDGDINAVDNIKVHGAIIATGDIKLHNNAILNGVAYTRSGKLELRDNSIVNGAVFAGGNKLEMRGNAKIDYNSDLAKISGQTSTATSTGYGRVSGSWSDMASN